MKSILISSLLLAATLAPAQNTTQDQPRHIKTALNHITIVEYGEGVTTLALADSDSFQVEKHDDKVLIKPLREGASTNLFVWTETRQFSYELDPAGSPSAMDVLIHTEPVKKEAAKHPNVTELSDDEIRRMVALSQTKTLMDEQDMVRDPFKAPQDGVSVELEQIYRAKDRCYLRYTVINRSAAPFRITAPDLYAAIPTAPGISLFGLRNHQLSPDTFHSYKATRGSSVELLTDDSAQVDLAPGQRTTEVIALAAPADGSPRLFELHLGADQKQLVMAAFVL